MDVACSSGEVATRDHTSQYRAVKAHFPDLVNQLQLVSTEAAHAFFSKSLITLADVTEVTSSQALYNSATKLMISVLTKIDSNVKLYSTLIEFLKKMDLKEVGEEIEKSRMMLEKESGELESLEVAHVPMLDSASTSVNSMDLVPSFYTPESARKEVTFSSELMKKEEFGKRSIRMDYIRKLADVESTKSYVETALAYLKKISQEEKKCMEDQILAFKKLHEDIREKNSIIECLKGDQERKSTELLESLIGFCEEDNERKAKRFKLNNANSVDSDSGDTRDLQRELALLEQKEREACEEVGHLTAQLACLQADKARTDQGGIKMHEKLERELKISSLSTAKLVAIKDKEINNVKKELIELKVKEFQEEGKNRTCNCCII